MKRQTLEMIRAAGEFKREADTVPDAAHDLAMVYSVRTKEEKNAIVARAIARLVSYLEAEE